MHAPRGADLTVADTAGHGHATELARDAASAGVDVVAVLGGDGTLNEAAQGLAGSDVALAALPGGSTNVFVRTIGTSYDLNRAATDTLDALARGSTERVGLGRVGDRVFLFHLGIGFDAAVVRTVERRPRMKRHLAHPAFAAAAIVTWARGYDRGTVLQIETTTGDGRATLPVASPFVVVSNSRPYTYLGRMPLTLAPQAGLDRDLAVTALHSIGLGLLARTLWASLRGGEALRHDPDVTQRGDALTVVVTGDRRFPYQVDGEYLGEAQRLDVRYEPDALTIVRP